MIFTQGNFFISAIINKMSRNRLNLKKISCTQVLLAAIIILLLFRINKESYKKRNDSLHTTAKCKFDWSGKCKKGYPNRIPIAGRDIACCKECPYPYKYRRTGKKGKYVERRSAYKANCVKPPPVKKTWEQLKKEMEGVKYNAF